MSNRRLSVKRKRGPEERLAFYSWTRKNVQALPNSDERLETELWLSTRWASAIIVMEFHPVVERITVPVGCAVAPCGFTAVTRENHRPDPLELTVVRTFQPERVLMPDFDVDSFVCVENAIVGRARSGHVRSHVS